MSWIDYQISVWESIKNLDGFDIDGCQMTLQNTFIGVQIEENIEY